MVRPRHPVHLHQRHLVFGNAYTHPRRSDRAPDIESELEVCEITGASKLRIRPHGFTVSGWGFAN
jgi:hypothetical protein